MTQPTMKTLMEALDWSEAEYYSVEDDDTGDRYEIEFQDEGGKEMGFIVANGQTIASFTFGGAGSMDAHVQNPNELINAIVAFAKK